MTNLLSEVRALLEHDNPSDDPLEKGLDEAVTVWCRIAESLR